MEDPEFYTTINRPQRSDADYITEEYYDEISEISGRCLDIGSGPGDVVADFILPKLNPKATIVCSDISDTMVAFGSEKYENNSRMSFVKLDIETPSLPEDMIGQFDHVSSNYCLHWCRDMGHVFGNIFKLLKPGGSALLLFVANHPVYSAYEVLADRPCFQPFTKDVNHYIPAFQHVNRQRQTLKSVLKDSGFDVQHCSCRERAYSFNDSGHVKKFFSTINPFLQRMPADLREIYEEELCREIMKEFDVCQKYSTIRDENEYYVLSRYNILVAYLKKPS